MCYLHLRWHVIHLLDFCKKLLPIIKLNIIHPYLQGPKQIAVNSWDIDSRVYHNDPCFARGWVVIGKRSLYSFHVVCKCHLAF